MGEPGKKKTPAPAFEEKKPVRERRRNQTNRQRAVRVKKAKMSKGDEDQEEARKIDQKTGAKEL